MSAHTRFASVLLRAGLALALALAFVAPAAAGPGMMTGPGNANLDEVEGLNELQRRTAASVQSACGSLADAGVSRDGKGATSSLFSTCQDLVQTSNELQGFGGTEFSLALSADELALALLGVVHDEGMSVGTSALQAVYVQKRNVGIRVAQLFHGSEGVSVAGMLDERHIDDTGRMPLHEQGAAGADLPLGVGVWLNADVNWGVFDGRGEEIGYDFDYWGVTGGADYRFTENFFAGLGVGYSQGDDDYENFTRSELESDSFTAHLYAGYQQGGFFADLLGSYTYTDFDLSRRIVFASIDRTAQGDTHAHEVSVSIGGGYHFSFGGLSLGPIARVEYTHIYIDPFGESGGGGLNLSWHSQEIRSFTTALGAEAMYAISTSWGILQPYVRAEWLHEFANDGRAIRAHYRADPFETPLVVRTSGPDRNFWTAGGGLSATFPRGLTAFVDYEAVLDLRDITSHQVTGGVRYAF